MAMAKPIVATNVSDLPLILDECGWIVDPESHAQLAEAIRDVLDNTGEAEKVGRKARQKCIDLDSWDAIEKELAGIFQRF